MTPKSLTAARRRLAKRIARDLFTSGIGWRARRLVLEIGDAIKDAGGWSQPSVAGRVQDALTRGNWRPGPKRKVRHYEDG